MDVVIPVEAGQIMILARALGDENAAYRDDGRDPKVEVIAPPTFTELRYYYDPDSAMRPRFEGAWYGSGAEATGTPGDHPTAVDYQLSEPGQMALPAETHFEYLEPIRPGDSLTMTERFNEQWEKETARSGLITFFDVIREFRNQHGRLVTIERIVWLVTDKGVEAG